MTSPPQGYEAVTPVGLVFTDDFERSKIAPWRYVDGRNDLLHIESSMAFRGTRCLSLRCGPGSTLIQDCSIILPVKGPVTFEHWFTFNPRSPATGNTLHSIERRQSAGSNTLLEMQIQYDFASGQVSFNKAGVMTLIKTFDNPLTGYDVTTGLNSQEPFIDETKAAGDIGDLSWHYFKMAVDITTGQYLYIRLDDFLMDLTTQGTALWNLLHTTTAYVNNTRFELHIITDQTANERNLLVDDVTITGN